MTIKGKKALVTGADGFIGSHLVENLLKNGCKVKALSYYNSFNFSGWLEGVNDDDLEIVSGDIRDPFFVDMITEDVDIVFHLAALIAIPFSYVAPQSYIETNVTGTLNICNAALKHGVEKIICTSTSEVYGTAMYVPIDEKHPKQPQSPYSASKIGADMIAMSYYNSFDLPVVIARPFNTYGPRQSARAFIPSMIIQILNGAKEIKVGDLTPTRDFNFVEDTCRGFVALMECDEVVGKEINIASNSEISMEDTLQSIKKVMKSDVVFTVDEARLRPSKSEVFRLYGDNTLINQITSHKPLVSLEKGLERTISWFSDNDNLSWYKSNKYNI